MKTPSVLDKAMRRLKEYVRRINVDLSFRHLSGPILTKLGSNDVALVLVGRNCAFFLLENIKYHLNMGVKHVVYVDNGSNDGSIDLIRAQPNVTVASSNADFRTDESLLRYFAVTKYLQGGWRLAIDCDEFFDYPNSSLIGLPDLTRLMHGRGFTCLLSQMLDLVPPGPLSEASNAAFSEEMKNFNRYSLSQITRAAYHDPTSRLFYFLQKNSVASKDVEILHGGLRSAAFQETCWLSKHALFKMSPGVTPMAHPHISTGLRCADFTALLKHYKFAGGVIDRERQLMAENRVYHNEAVLRSKQFELNPDLSLGRFAEFANPDPMKLIEQGFLVASPEARRMLKF